MSDKYQTGDKERLSRLHPGMGFGLQARRLDEGEAHRLDRTGGPGGGLFQFHAGGDSVDIDLDNRQSDFDIDDRQPDFDLNNRQPDVDVDDRKSDDYNHDRVVDKGVSAVPGGRHCR
jgi:hypothetical protein